MIVVGAGPTGLLLAGDLARACIDVTAVRQLRPRPDPVAGQVPLPAVHAAVQHGTGIGRTGASPVGWASPGQSPRWRLRKPFSPLRADGRVLSRSEVMARAPGGSLASRPSSPPG
ncbi:hypothetical protein [Nonomuraea phyllanthi]|uniref:hypothetical protein n=1 Tax=Nonomuraea phyllanthi TaxID=2219224 RepID=UPI003743C601